MTRRKSKLAKIFPLCLATSNSGELNRIVKAEINFLLVNNDSSSPFSASLEPTYAGNARGVVCGRLLVRMVLRVRAFSKILSSTIERISIPMIDLALGFAAYLAMQVDSAWLAFSSTSRCIEAFCESAIFSVPVPLYCPFVITSVNDSALASSQSNQTHRFFGRLNNCLSLFRVCHTEILSVDFEGV